MTESDTTEAAHCAKGGCEDPADGLLCPRHLFAVTTALASLEGLYGQLRTEAYQMRSSGSGDRISGSRERALPGGNPSSVADDIAGWLIDTEDMLRAELGLCPAGRQPQWTVTIPNPFIEGAPSRLIYVGYDRAEAEQTAVQAGEHAVLDVAHAMDAMRRDAVNHPSEVGQVERASGFLVPRINELLNAGPGNYVPDEVWSLCSRARQALGLHSGDVSLSMPCPECGARALRRRDGHDDIQCSPRDGGCGMVEAGDRMRYLVRALAVDMPEQVMPAAQAAELAGVSHSTVSRAAASGRLPAVAMTVRKPRQALYRVADIMALGEKATA